MADGRDAGVDPRFDPVFQRGYDPERHGTRRGRRPEPEPRVRTDRLDERPSAGNPGDRPALAPVSPTAHPEPGPDADAPAPDVEDEPDIPTGPNPFRLALLLVSVAAFIGSAAMLWVRLTGDPLDQYYGSDPGRMFRQQFVDALPVPLLTAGLIGLVLWLALGVVRSRRDA
ncbi:MAG: hypothetical protein R2717_01245 [Schumannella sp.]|nr:hypothetical protein [Microbacteriaceae bacterium]